MGTAEGLLTRAAAVCSGVLFVSFSPSSFFPTAKEKAFHEQGQLQGGEWGKHFKRAMAWFSLIPT